MSNFLPTYEVARLYQNSLVVYKIIEYPKSKTEKQKANESNLTRGQFNGFLSQKSKSKIKRIISPWLNSIIQFRNSKVRPQVTKTPYPTFITLTLPSKQVHNDCEIKRECLNPFLINMQRKFNVREYFWICETQENGNLHFHIIADSFIPHQKVRELWNSCVERLGYITSFEKNHQHRNPNSTDIHKIENVESIESYVMKYVSKGGGSRVIRGKIWDCSKGIKQLRPLELVTDADVTECINKISNSISFRRYDDQNVTVFVGDILGFSSVHCKSLHRKMLKHWSDCITEIYGRKEKSSSLRAPVKASYIEYFKPEKIPIISTQIECPF